MTDTSSLKRVTSIWHQLLATEEGVRHNAADALFNAGLDPRNYELVPVDPQSRAAIDAIELRFRRLDNVSGAPELRVKLKTLREERRGANERIRTYKKIISELKCENKSLRKQLKSKRK